MGFIEYNIYACIASVVTKKKFNIFFKSKIYVGIKLVFYSVMYSCKM